MTRHVIKINKFTDFIAEANKLGMRGWIYRGHGGADWTIEPLLQRFWRTHQENIKASSHHVRERDAIRKFQRLAHHELKNIPDTNEFLEWLAIMQHFGAPTRLLDFTYSPYAALYFAADGSVDDVRANENLNKNQLNKKYRPFVVHALHLDTYRKHAKQGLITAGITVDGNDPCPSDYRIGQGHAQVVDFIGFYEGRWNNPRQVAQQGLFMVPSRVDLDIETYLQSVTWSRQILPYNNPWIRFEFKGGRLFFKEIVKNLLISGNTTANLFPGLEGLARGLRYRMYEVIKDLA